MRKRGGAGEVGSQGSDGRRHRLKHGEPQGRIRVATHASRQGGANRRGGAQNHEVGTWMRRGSRVPKEVGRPGNRAVGLRERTPWRVIRRRGDLWTIPREEARTTGHDAATAWGTTSGKQSALQPEFEPQDRVASGKTARRSTGRACIPNQDVRTRDDESSKAATMATAIDRRPWRAAAKANEPQHHLVLPLESEGFMLAWSDGRRAGGRQPVTERSLGEQR